MYETAAASVHTPDVVSTEGTGGYVQALVIVTGDLVFLDGNAIGCLAIENWKTALQRYLAYCEKHGIAPRAPYSVPLILCEATLLSCCVALTGL